MKKAKEKKHFSQAHKLKKPFAETAPPLQMKL